MIDQCVVTKKSSSIITKTEALPVLWQAEKLLAANSAQAGMIEHA
jgi:hypothetical protein